MGENEGYGGGDSVVVRVERTASKSSWAFSSSNAFLTILGSVFNWDESMKELPAYEPEQGKECSWPLF